MDLYAAYIDSPIGRMKIVSTKDKITALEFIEEQEGFCIYNLCGVLEQCLGELMEYFKGTRINFSVPIEMQGTEFQQKVWHALQTISYGETKSYKDIAIFIGKEKAARAVGSANHLNKIPIFIPCHRVIGSNGRMVGYAGGLWRKQWLLAHERNFTANI